MKVDNFALSNFMSCPAKYKLRMVDGWTIRRKSAALGFGGVLHEALAAWYKTGLVGKGLEAINEKWPAEYPIDDYRTKTKCAEVFLQYTKNYPVENWHIVGMPDQPQIEVTFTLDTGMFLPCWFCEGLDSSDRWNPVCSRCGERKEVIEYGGIFDGLVEFSSNVYVLEHKSTSQMGPYYFNQFKPNNQVTGYTWAGGKLSGGRVAGAIINAIGVYKASPTKFAREITTRSSNEIDEWLENVYNVCRQIKDCERREFWPMYTPSCTQFGKCEYHDVHVLGHPTERAKRLEQDYVKQPWSYEARDLGATPSE